MESNAYRDDDKGQPDAYWRRRVITLCAGLTLLGLLAWAFSGGGGKPAAAARKGAQSSGALPAAAYSGAPTSPSPGADAPASAGSSASMPFLTASPSPGASTAGNGASASSKAAVGAAAAAGATAGPGTAGPGTAGPGTARPGTARPGTAGPASGVEPGGGCAPGAVVLSLFTSKAFYRAGQYPVFGVYAVSTASRACTFDLSPAKLHVLVSSSGRIIWDSADCTRGEPNRVATFRRGVPVQKSFTWNRSISLPGCVTVASSARDGSYQVQARGTSVASPVRTFKLAR